MRTSKRLVTFVVTLFLLLPFVSPHAKALEVSAQCAVLMDTQSGRFLYEKNPENPMLIASTTKIMTALVVISRCNLDEMVTVRKEQTGVEGSSMYLKPDEQISVRDLLYGLLLASGNDAAETLAVHCAGSIPSFAEMMNETARMLRLTDTHFANPHGLNANQHYSCARDMAVIAQEAMKNEEFRRIVSTKTITLDERVLKNHNKLLWDYEGAIGLKTGYTMKAGRCLVSAAERDGRMLIAVTLNAPNDWKDHAALFDAGFKTFKTRTLCTDGDVLGSVPVVSGVVRSVQVYAEETLTMPLTDEELSRVELVPELPRFIWAPMTQGAVIGKARFMLDGRLLCQTDLCCAQDVPEQTEKTFWQNLSELWDRVSGRAPTNG